MRDCRRSLEEMYDERRGNSLFIATMSIRFKLILWFLRRREIGRTNDRLETSMAPLVPADVTRLGRRRKCFIRDRDRRLFALYVLAMYAEIIVFSLAMKCT